ncbi:hypothetical protein RhiirA4_550399 [Rhizophagus irregularis]|uniref:Hsp70 family protein n=1 Tax=Rhizophagus irregularis TaxID=588596 RepID=A0A2I1HKZ6_9GLOM|nr:hypothetical protein RhiirA4_550399 [Rhizophagus irregularis]
MKIMRKCAYDVGIINEGSENLEFTTEPEAAAVYRMKKKEYHIGVGSSSTAVVDWWYGRFDDTFLSKNWYNSVKFILLKIELCSILKQCVKGEKYDEMENMEWIIELTFDDVKLMFNPVIERIISLIHKQLDKSHENGYDICAMMFLVGGFSESKYLQARIKKGFGDKVPNISVPIQPVTAVVREAKRGDQVAVNEKIVKTYYPLNTVQKKLGLDIYVTRKDSATYCDEPGVELLDSWCADIPNASKENRAFEFTLTFGKVEIEAIAQAKTGEKYENTFDLDM